MKLNVATCQFSVDADICRNVQHIRKQLLVARERGADVAHFPEGSLSGYAGSEIKSFANFDWKLLAESTDEVIEQARALRIWVVLGSAHRLTGRHKPHNCLYIIDDQGRIADRYDKMFCAGDREEKTGDLAYYSPGNHFCVFTIKGVRCGALICHEYRYPELYREYKRRGVQLMFHSYHAGHLSAKQMQEMRQQVGARFHKLNPGSTLPEITMPAAMHSRAADNYVWISCSNTSARESCWPSFIVRPDGVIVGRLRRNRAGVLCSTVDTDEPYYDSTSTWRDRAMSGIWHSGTLVRDSRSDQRTHL
jgi:deaminated glutathione amidase